VPVQNNHAAGTSLYCGDWRSQTAASQAQRVLCVDVVENWEELCASCNNVPNNDAELRFLGRRRIMEHDAEYF
jgi:hypothetical protein